MSGKFFLDTNLLIYAIDPTDVGKHRTAQKWIAAAHETGDGVVSYQVVQEWFNVVLRRAAVPLSADEAAMLYHQMIKPLWRIQSSRDLLDTAIDLYHRDSLSWWDSLIVSAAIQGDCQTIISEDLQHGRKLRGVRVLNPFRARK